MTITDEAGQALFEAAGLDPRQVPDGGAVDVAVELYGDSIIRLLPKALALGSLASVGNVRQIVVSANVAPSTLNYAIATQLAALFLERQGAGLVPFISDRGAFCRQLGAWIVAPPEAFRAEIRTVGLDVSALASAFTMSTTSAAIRIPEVGGPDGVVVTPREVHRRGKLLSWMSDADVRELAGRRHVRSLRREVVRSNPTCVALFARAA